MKSDKLAILAIALLLVAGIGGFAAYLTSDTNRNLSYPPPPQDRIAELETLLTEKGSSVQALEKQLAAKAQRLEEMAAEIAEAKNADANANHALQEMQARFASLQSTLSEAQGQLDARATQLTALEREAGTLRDEAAHLRQNLDKAMLATRKQQTLIGEQHARIQELEERLAGSSPAGSR